MGLMFTREQTQNGEVVANCMFCGIVQGQLPSTIVWEDDRIVAFRDINPQAPTHILIIPKQHIDSLDAATPNDLHVLGHLLISAQRIARDERLDSGHRLILNTGKDARQTVSHLHLHLLGGRRLEWPPG